MTWQPREERFARRRDQVRGQRVGQAVNVDHVDVRAERVARHADPEQCNGWYGRVPFERDAQTPIVRIERFDLKVEPAALRIPQGGKAKVKITATRKAGYQGPIALELRDLPANVTAPKTTIDMGQNSSEVEISVPANAAPGEKKDVNVLGTATAANQQNASPNFTVVVEKK